jgi:glycosyltransferase involved in cell wall biosynthesis
MKIVMFSITPLFPDRVMGGAQKHLQAVAIHLGELGHDVIIFTTRRSDTNRAFHWHERVQVRPVLRFKQPFPGPYDTPAYDLAFNVQTLGAALQDADRFYMHDGEFLFPFAYHHIPTVVSLRDNVYPETQLGSFLFAGDALVLISEFSRQYYLHTAGRFFPELAERMIVIHNGLDWERFSPTPAAEILDYLTVDPARDNIVLHPHRPEVSKGLPQTVEVVDRLVHDYEIPNLKVLVPQWIDVGLSSDIRAYYEGIQADLAARGLTDNFVFHGWIPQELMPQYYSLGAVTLSLGHFVESFGNAVYESLGCGTPTIAARIATHRELLPDDMLDKVHFNDHEAAAAVAAEIIRTGRRTTPETLDYLKTHYGVERQLAAYADVILGARKRPPPAYKVRPLDGTTRYRLAPWSYEWEGGFYHDYLARHTPLPALSALLANYPEGFTLTEARASGVTPEAVDAWYTNGFVVPLQGNDA